MFTTVCNYFFTIKTVRNYLQWKILKIVISSHSQRFFKIGALKIFSNFTRKQLCWSLFFNKVAGLRRKIYKFIKKETPTQVFSCEICKNFKNTYFEEHLHNDYFWIFYFVFL